MAVHMRFLEHEKLKAVSDKTQFVHDFLEFLGERGIRLIQPCAEDEERDLCDVGIGERDRLLYEFIDVDPDELEREKRAMLGAIRGEREWPTGKKVRRG